MSGLITKWVYECPDAPRNALHHWIMNWDGTAECKYCKVMLDKEEAKECFTQR